MEALTPSELAAWDRPGPRYTSYPPVPLWTVPEPGVVARALGALRTPAQLYVHIPFCHWQCSYCGCNMVVAGRRAAGTRYLECLERALERLPLAADRVAVQRIHLGGGTPTWLEPEELVHLHQLLLTRFSPEAGAELSLEAHPAVTRPEHLATLQALGFTRISLGVQSLDPAVLEAVGRPSTGAQVEALVEDAHARGMGVGLDLMYGLPAQSLRGFHETLDRVIAWRPERMAVFGYAHVPWVKSHQSRIDSSLLPDTLARAALAMLAADRLQTAGYLPIGFDHYALPEDELGRAAQQGSLHRNFMGTTTLPEVDMVGIGASAISEVAGVYWQDEPHLGRWQRKVDAGEELAVRGCVLTEDDRVRRFVINALLSGLRVDAAPLRERFGVDLSDYFAWALRSLRPMQEAGLVEIDAEHVEVTPRGRPLARLVAQAFDGAISSGIGLEPKYSQAV